MLCPKCDTDSHVLDTRRGDGNTLRRRRECNRCRYRFTTYEVVVGGAKPKQPVILVLPNQRTAEELRQLLKTIDAALPQDLGRERSGANAEQSDEAEGEPLPVLPPA